MRCPRCSAELVEREAARRASYHACDAHGGYIARDELHHALPFAAHAALEEARERASAGDAPCPSCGAAMGLATLVRHGDAIELDVCHACGGCWFDHEELERARAAPRGTGRTGAPEHARALSGGEGAAQVVVDPVAWVALIDLLHGLLE